MDSEADHKIVTFLVGAGASAKALPTIDKLPDRLRSFEDFFRSQTFAKNRHAPYRDELSAGLQLMYNKLIRHEANENIKLHETVDTFAKKLNILEKDNCTPKDIDLTKLKILLCLFFASEQLTMGIDIRYDSFFASILGNTAKKLPERIRIVSWNYDNQFELAYR